MNFKHKAYIIILLLLSIFTISLAQAATINIVTEEYPPYNYTKNNKVTGFCTDIVKAILKRTKTDYTIESNPWSVSYKKAKTKPNILIYSIGRSIQREPLFKWVDVLARTEVYFYKLKSRHEIKIKAFDDIKKYKIGAVRDDFRTQWLTKHGMANKLKLVDSDRQNMVNLFERKIDIFPIGEYVAYYIAHQEGQAFNSLKKTMYIKDMSADLYMAFSLETSDEIVEKSKKALLNIKQDGTLEKIKSKYAIFYLPVFKISTY